jgi:O-antigen/teichoic acid export membrane protein
MPTPTQPNSPEFDAEPADPKRGSGAKAAWRNVLGNASVILSERIAFGVVSIAAAAVAMRAVGFEAFGAVVLVHAYARLFGDMLRFQSWQAVLRYGAPALADGQTQDLRRLLGLTLRIDLIALTGSITAAILFSGFAASIFNWPEATARWAPFYALAIPFMSTDTPTGVLRLLDRFGILAVRHAMNASIRLAGAALVWMLEIEGQSGAAALIAVWFLASVLSGGWMIAMALLMLRRRNLLPQMRGNWSEMRAGFHGFWGFVLATNASTTIVTAVANATTLVVGGVLGASAAGLFGVVRQFADSFGKPAKLLGPVIFPELGRLRAEKRRKSLDGLILRALGAGTTAVVVIAGVMALAGGPLLEFAFGAEALQAYYLMIFATVAASLSIWGFSLEPALLSAGRAGISLAIQCSAAALYALTLFGLLSMGGGLTEIGIALLMNAVLVFLARLGAVWKFRHLWPEESGKAGYSL